MRVLLLFGFLIGTLASAQTAASTTVLDNTRPSVEVLGYADVAKLRDLEDQQKHLTEQQEQLKAKIDDLRAELSTKYFPNVWTCSSLTFDNSLRFIIIEHPVYFGLTAFAGVRSNGISGKNSFTRACDNPDNYFGYWVTGATVVLTGTTTSKNGQIHGLTEKKK